MEESIEDDIAAMQDCLIKVKDELETRVNDLGDVFEESPSNCSTIKAEFARIEPPNPPFSVSYPKLPMKDDFFTTRMVAKQTRPPNENRLSLNTNLFMRTTH